MHSTSRLLAGHALLLVAALGLGLPACGGGGGGGSQGNGFSGTLTDPVVPMLGNPGVLSQTPEEANAGNGTTPPPSYQPAITTDNHWFRLEFPFRIDRSTVIQNSPSLAPFSYLTGSITVTDPSGQHIPGIAMVNGVDAQGVNRAKDSNGNYKAGFPKDIDPVTHVDRNLGTNVFLYVADVDNNLATLAAWGFTLDANNNPVETQTAFDGTVPLDMVRVTADNVNNAPIHGAWSFHIGSGPDTRPPFVLSVTSEVKDPTDPANPATVDFASGFLLEFSKPMVPQSVGRSATLNGVPFTGNLPLPPYATPLPNTTLTATLNTSVGTLYVPFDCSPISKNNLATYRLKPLINLPPKASVAVLERALTGNSGKAAIDLSGNFYDGQDTDIPPDGIGNGTDMTSSFTVGPGPAVVNIPVSPEVVYALPSVGDGIMAVDLNGFGFTTNTPGKNAGVRERASIITNSANINLVSGIALIGHPFEIGIAQYNRYSYAVGTGGYKYGAPYTVGWLGDPTDNGNGGTPFPGVNEMSSGFETMCRDSNGDTILTGRTFSNVGNVQDLMVGEFLDTIFFDTQNPWAVPTFHLSIFAGKVNSLGRNLISDPPTPNPPPTRYWLGLPPVDVTFDQFDPQVPAQVIDGDEVFVGVRAGMVGFSQFQPNTLNPNAPDQTIFPHFPNGPGPQSASQAYTFSARQQIGNILYATDATNREVQAINSNTMRVISSISLPDPNGLAMSPNLQYLYVTNFSDDTISVIGADPTASNFHQEVARVHAGFGPKAIAVQPGNEDIFVCNFLGNSVSIVDPHSLTSRKELTSLVAQPYDVEATERQLDPNSGHPFGWACGIYFAYISNFGGNSVLVYESGPAGATGIGLDNIRGAVPTGDNTEPIIQPRGLCFSPFADPSGFFAGGCFVAHQDDLGFGRVTHIQFTLQAIYGPLPVTAPPGFYIPPGFRDRNFEVVGTWGNTDSNRLAGHRPMDVTLADEGVLGYQQKPSAAPNSGGIVSTPASPEQTGFVNSKNHMRLAPNSMFVAWTPDRLYVAFDDTDKIQVVNPTQAGTIANTIEGHGNLGTKKLCTYWRQ